MKQLLVSKSRNKSFKKVSALLQAGILALASLAPILVLTPASAAQLSARKATIDKSAVSSTNVQFAFTYTVQDTAATKQGITYEFCNTPLGTCILPTGMDVQTSNTQVSQTGWPVNTTAFAPLTEIADVGACTVLTNAYMNCYTRTQIATGGGAVTHTIAGITAPSSTQSVYVRIGIYSDALFTTLLDTGTVAVSFADQITVNGRVQERLNFCVSALNDVAAIPATVTACAALTDTNVDLGIIDETSVAETPVNIITGVGANGADDDFGILMLNTNATGGANVSYFPAIAATGTNQLTSFRVTGATCSAVITSEQDQCFVNAINSGLGTTLATATEGFGLQIPCIDTTNGVTTALGSVPAWYAGDGTTTTSVDCENTDVSSVYGWNVSGTTADTLASSTSVVDDEIVKVRFGAAAAPTTPSGEYTVVTNYIATGTF